MTLPVYPNPISIDDLRTEFGVAGQKSLEDFYAGGSIVSAGTLGFPSGGGGVAIPSSGQISLNDFHGASSQFELTIASNQTNLNVRTLAISSGWNQTARLRVVINPGIYVYGIESFLSSIAMDFTGDYPSGVELVNYGFIMGLGGNGGSASGNSLIFPGDAGGAAIRFQADRPFSIINAGFIGGGGGGGVAVGNTTNVQNVGPGGGGGAGGGRGGSSLGFDGSRPGGLGGEPGQRGQWGPNFTDPQPTGSWYSTGDVVEGGVDGATRNFYPGAGGGRIGTLDSIVEGGNETAYLTNTNVYAAPAGGQAGGAGGSNGVPGLGVVTSTQVRGGGNNNITGRVEPSWWPFAFTGTYYTGAGGGGWGQRGGMQYLNGVFIYGGAAGQAVIRKSGSTYSYSAQGSGRIWGPISTY